VIFPPPVTTLEVQAVPGHPVLVLQRLQEFKGNRSKWFHHKFTVHADVSAQIKQKEDEGWFLLGPVVVPLEVDDYQAAWSGKTPHKAIRAVERATLAVLGTTVK
jgi:hypothetical protein